MTERRAHDANADGALLAGPEGLADIAPDGIPAWVASIATAAGFADATVYLADLQETVLTPLPPSQGAPEQIEGTLAGRVFQRGTPLQGTGNSWWFPLIDCGERLGVLSVTDRGMPSGDAVSVGERLAALAALVITSRRSRTDAIVLASRTSDVSLAAELRWSLMPPRTLTARGVCVSGHLEPAYEIAGDSYDYALNGDTLDLAVFDAMGHGLAASRLANLAVSSYRHSRRRGADPPTMYHDMDEAVLSEFGDGMFVTAHLARLQISTGVLSVVNAGHPHPMLIRGGAAHPLHFAPATPIGLGFVNAEAGEIRLEPGDAVLIFSDGVTEARSAGGDLFGLDRLGDLTARAIGGGESIPETVRRLVTSLLNHRGVDLEDDATFVLLCWRQP